MRPVLLLVVFVLAAAPAGAGTRDGGRSKSLFQVHSIDLGSVGSWDSQGDRRADDTEALMLNRPSAPTATGRSLLPSFNFGPIHGSIGAGNGEGTHFGSGPAGTNKDVWGPTVQGPRSAKVMFTLPVH